MANNSERKTQECLEILRFAAELFATEGRRPVNDSEAVALTFRVRPWARHAGA
jgi:hypothetical protein